MNKIDFERKLFGDDWMSPNLVIERFNIARQKYGEDKLLHDNRFKKAKEVWVTAMLLLGLRSKEEREYWLKPIYDEPAPDTLGIFCEPHPSIPESDTHYILRIEVTEWEGHSHETLVERICNKLHNKDYPDTSLVVYIRRAGDVVDLDAAFEELQHKDLKIKEVILLYMEKDHEAVGQYTLVWMYPAKQLIKFSPAIELTKGKDQVGVMKLVRKKGHGWLYKHGHELPFPELPI